MVTKPSLESQEVSKTQSASGGWLSSLLILIFRLLLLGVGSVSAILIGIAVASIEPGEIDTVPPLEKLFQKAIEFR